MSEPKKPSATIPTKVQFTLLPGARFLIRGLAKIDQDEPVPVEVDLGIGLDLTGHTVCAAVVKNAILEGIKKAGAQGRIRRIDTEKVFTAGAQPLAIEPR